jgi:4-diphosphocytidyl-2-C-methyl-D-erythritol kinase
MVCSNYSEIYSEIFLAPAKVNIMLRFVGRLKNGYHLLETIIAPITLYDEIEIAVSNEYIGRKSEIQLHCSFSNELKTHLKALQANGEDIEGILDSINSHVENLASSAAREVLNLIEPSQGRKIGINIQKRIPFQAGLGGGSSDAATTIHGLLSILNKLDPKTEINHEKIEILASRLGADVLPLYQRNLVFAYGIGDKIIHNWRELNPIRDWLERFFLIIVKPPFGINTKQAYQYIRDYKQELPVFESIEEYLSSYDKNNDTILTINSIRDTGLKFKLLLQNDFEEIITAKHPEILSLKNYLIELGACWSLLAGSGSAVVGFVDCEDKAYKISNMLSEKFGENTFVSLARFHVT